METETVYSFLDIGPLSKGHALIIPKCTSVHRTEMTHLAHTPYHHETDHAEKMHELPDEYFADVLPAAKKIALALNAENYNLLQVSILAHPWRSLYTHTVFV